MGPLAQDEQWFGTLHSLEWYAERLLVGALRMESDEVRRQGVGHLLGRVNLSVVGGAAG